MILFLGAELYGAAGHYWFDLQKEFTQKLNQLKDKNYGGELNNIAIISIIMPEDFFEENGYPEKKLFKRKTKEADIRLRIDYERFIRVKSEQRRQIYIDHIIQALNTLKPKLSKSFRFDDLINDVVNVLSA